MQRDYVPLFRSICTSDKLADLPGHECRLFYVLLLSQCDSWGRIADSPRALCASVWAMFGGTVKETTRVLTELAKTGLIERRAINGQAWIQVTNWEPNAGSIGRPERRGVSKFPGPSPDSVPTKSADSECYADEVRSEQSRAEQSRAEESRTRARGRAAAAPLDLDSLVAGSSLDTPTAKEAIRQWLAYKSQKGQGYKPIGIKALLSKLSEWGPVRAEAAIRHSIAQNYAGIFEPSGPNGNGPNGKVEPKGFQALRDYKFAPNGGSNASA